jgi:NitT/TauT family transport system substrate-binding protein
MTNRLTRAQLLAGGAAALAFAPPIVRAQALEKIQLAATPADDLTPALYAIKNGLYEKAGLDVEYVPTSSGGAAATAVVAGTYQMGAGSLISSLNAYLRGVPLAVVANGGIWDPRYPFAQILVAADSPMKSAAELNGKVAASPALNDLNELAIDAWMDKNGGDSQSLKWVEVPNSAVAEALAQHRIDVCAMNEPALTAALEAGKVRAIAPAYTSISEHFVFQLYFANADWAAKHRDALRRWVRTTYQAAAYINTHDAETAELTADVTKIPLRVMQKILRVHAATSSDPKLVQPAIDAAAKYKTISRAFRAEELYFNL